MIGEPHKVDVEISVDCSVAEWNSELGGYEHDHNKSPMNVKRNLVKSDYLTQ